MTKPGNEQTAQTGRQTDRYTNRQAGKPADRQTDRQASGQIDRQTDNQTTFIKERTFDIGSGCTGPFLPECRIQSEWCHHRTTPKNVSPA